MRQSLYRKSIMTTRLVDAIDRTWYLDESFRGDFLLGDTLKEGQEGREPYYNKSMQFVVDYAQCQ